MKKLGKIASVAGSLLMGASLVLAAVPYTNTGAADVAIIYGGADAATTDYNTAMQLNAQATTALAGLGGAVTTTGGVTETEVALGGYINTTAASAASKITASLTDSKIDSLLDTKIRWDDGGASGADDYNIHEEILVGGMSIKTTLDDNDFEELLAMTNDKDLEYRYVFDDAFANASAVGGASADDLYLTILGKSYEISAMTATQLTVVTSQEYSLGPGESVTVDGVTYTVDDLSSTAVKVNGETIADGATKKISGLQVEVKDGSIFYNENFPSEATVTLKIGDDISKTYTNGEEYVGEDEEDPMWVWSFSDNITAAAGYIGVKYNQKETRDTDNVVYQGGSYALPGNFAAVTFVGTTDVDYEDFKIYFDDSEDLWNSSDLTSTAQTLDAPVLIIEAVNGANDAFQLTNGSTETDKIYLRWAATPAVQTQNKGLVNASLELFYSDVDGTVQDAIKPRFLDAYQTTGSGNNDTLAEVDLGDMIVGDTTVRIGASIVSGNLQLNFTDGGAIQNITVDVGGAALVNVSGSLKWFGGDTETTDKEAALAGDLMVGGINVGTYDNDIMTTNGLIVKKPEANLDNDEVIISVPSDRVYAIVSVGTGVTSTSEVGAILAMDTEANQYANANWVVVGGNCVNSVAADLLNTGAGNCLSAFEAATGAGAGEFLIKEVTRSNGKMALIVAGYAAADTVKAGQKVLNENYAEGVYTTATNAIVTTA